MEAEPVANMSTYVYKQWGAGVSVLPWYQLALVN